MDNNQTLDMLMNEVRVGFGGIRSSISGNVDTKNLTKVVSDLTNTIKLYGNDFVKSKQQSVDEQNKKWVNELKKQDSNKNPVKTTDSTTDKLFVMLADQNKQIDLLSKMIVPVATPIPEKKDTGMFNIGATVGEQLKTALKQEIKSPEPILPIQKPMKLATNDNIDKENVKVTKIKEPEPSIFSLNKPTINNQNATPVFKPTEKKLVNNTERIIEKTNTIIKEPIQPKQLLQTESKFIDVPKKSEKIISEPKIIEKTIVNNVATPDYKPLSINKPEIVKVISEPKKIETPVANTIVKPDYKPLSVNNTDNKTVNKTDTKNVNNENKLINSITNIIDKSISNNTSGLKNNTYTLKSNETTQPSIIKNNVSTINKEMFAIEKLKSEGKIENNNYYKSNSVNSVNKSIMNSDNINRQIAQPKVNLASANQKVDTSAKVSDMQLQAKLIAIEILNVLKHPEIIANQERMVDKQAYATTRALTS